MVPAADVAFAYEVVKMEIQRLPPHGPTEEVKTWEAWQERPVQLVSFE